MVSFLLIIALVLAAALAPPRSSSAQVRQRETVTIPYSEAEPLFALLAPNVPTELRRMSPAELRDAWSAWLGRRNAEIRARVARGDEDSLVNLWLFGTSFTTLRPARGAHASIADARLDDLLDAVALPRSNTRLEAGRQLLASRGIDVSTSLGRLRARQLLIDWRARAIAETAEYERALAAANRDSGFAQARAYASLYEGRGLSSDTSLLPSFAIDAALGALQKSAAWDGRPVRRIAVVGPGLDIINKADGHDFYPEQTIQPFAVIDLLVRRGLASASDISVVTMDVSERVNSHLTSARQRAFMGQAYLLHVPLSGSDRWSPELEEYWVQFGASLGTPTAPAKVPAVARNALKIRALHVRPEIVRVVTPAHVNVVLERLEPGDGEEFDLVIATNVFAYYGTFEQALAVTNIGRMLRPGGSLLSNQAVLPVPPMMSEVGEHRVRYSDRQFDTVFWYRRR